MSRFDTSYPPPHASLSHNTGPLHLPPKAERHDERASHSDSEDSYSHFPDAPKAETDLEEDGNNSLTTQTLNADGTPKRPMNAFMIFARRRRPQVSADNQAMRTGEISKLLSKEWKALQASEKQFYLDQAKQLKETFNTKYPDYVYRRRPNNSRKRRRTDGVVSRPAENPVPSEFGDDTSGLGDTGDSSPTDGEDSQTDASDHRYSRSAHEVSRDYGEISKYGPSSTRASGYPYPPSEASYRSGSHDHRAPFTSSGQERLSHNFTSSPPVPSARLSQSMHSATQQAYASTQTQPQPMHMYDPISQVQGNWDRADRGRSSAWLGHDRPVSALGAKHSPFNPPSSHNTWANSAALTSSTPPSGPSSPFTFPTLTSPFYPSQSPHPRDYPNSTSSSASQSHSSSQYNSQSNHLLPSLPAVDYENRRYAPSPSVSPANLYPTANNTRDHALYSHRQSLPRATLPPVQSISNYSNTQTLQNSPPRTVHSAPQNDYWTPKLEGI